MTTTYEKLAKVVFVIDEQKVAINRGQEDGVQMGDKFLIFRLGEQIVDPDTGDNLGQLEIVIGRARVAHVQDRLSTLESISTKNIPGRKRIIKKTGTIALLGIGEEEIEENPSTVIQDLDAAQGDLAKPI